MSLLFRGGYHKASQKFCKTDLDVNLSGRVVIVTGANSGIGKSASVSLASKGAEIHMVCRSEERANAARADIIKESKNEVNICLLLMFDAKKYYIVILKDIYM